MKKLLILAAALFGCWIALKTLAPKAVWVSAFTISNHPIPWAYIGLCAMGLLVWKSVK